MKNFKLPMNLQFFAEPGDEGGNEGGSNQASSTSSAASGASSTASGSSSAASSAAKSYSEDYIAKMRKDYESKVKEAEKKAKMTADERNKYEQDKAKREFEAAQAKIATYEMRDTARELAKSMEFNVTDADVRFAATSDKETTESNLKYLKSVYERGVKATKDEYLKGNPAHVSGKSIKGGKKENYGSKLAKQNHKEVDNPYFQNK